MTRSSSKRKVGRVGKSPRLKSPWSNNGVRRRWARIVFAIIVSFVAIIATLNLDGLFARTTTPLPRVLVLALGLLALPALYPLARRLGASRSTALWAMALLGVNVPWLLHLRHGDLSVVTPVLVMLACFCYLQVASASRLAWVGLGGALLGIFVCQPLAACGVVLGLLLHAAGWCRQREQWQQYGLAVGLFAATAIPCSMLLHAGNMTVQWDAFVPNLVGFFLLVNAWLLPLLALPLLYLILFNDPAARWRPHAEVALLGLLIAGVLLTAGFQRHAGLRDLLSLAPLAALWLAMGLTRIQARTPVWAWAPVGVLLVATTLPQWLVSRGVCATCLRQRMNGTLAGRMQQPSADMLVPMYTYIKGELADNYAWAALNERWCADGKYRPASLRTQGFRNATVPRQILLVKQGKDGKR